MIFTPLYELGMQYAQEQIRKHGIRCWDRLAFEAENSLDRNEFDQGIEAVLAQTNKEEQ